MECGACGEPVEGDTASLWFNAPLGLTCRHTHRTQECARKLVAEYEAIGWKFRPDGPPLPKAERAKRGLE